MKKSVNILKGLKTVVAASAVLGVVMLQPVSAAVLESEVVAKAAPDECFNGLGQDYDGVHPIPAFNTWNVDDCTDEAPPKVNQAYVWGMTKTDTHVWFGTAPNTLCMVNGTYHQQTTTTLNDSWVCEQSVSRYPDFMSGVTGQDYSALKLMGLGDWRTPKIYRYNIATGENEDKTPNPLTPEGQLILSTVGLRSAGTHNGVVFLAGPGFGGGDSSVNMFAFNAATGDFLESRAFTDYDNIRKWIVANNELYTAVGDKNATVVGETEEYAGRVLKWEGDITDPFNFKEVGYLPGSGAELAFHDGRLFVTTWPGAELTGSAAFSGLYMSETVPTTGGLDTLTVWKEIWNAAEYEPDPVVARTYGGGAVASFDGHLYWGTMHVPGLALAAAVLFYDLNTSDEELMQEAMMATNRAISIYRASNFDNNDTGTKELLYGESTLKQYSPPNNTFVDVPNKMGTALWGEAGFGNKLNNYTWTMNVFKDILYVGTMDWGYLLDEMLKSSDMSSLEIALLLNKLGIDINAGADLWRIESSAGSGAIAEDLTGIGNYGSYGIRTMVSDADHLYLGMANPMNLMTDLTDDKPEGGWELIKMSEKTSTGGSSGGGGGCTYNPDSTKFDMMIFFLLALSLLYAGRRRLIK